MYGFLTGFTPPESISVYLKKQNFCFAKKMTNPVFQKPMQKQDLCIFNQRKWFLEE